MARVQSAMPARHLLGLCLLLSAAFLCSCKDASIAPRIDRTASNVDGFDLVFDAASTRAAFGSFELGYAVKANYSYFTYRGKLYRSVGGGSVLIRPTTSSPSQYIVRETALTSEDDGHIKTSLIQILDKDSGKELARRSLVAHAVEDGTGWTGDHAVKFVRKVLNSRQTRGRPLGVIDYEPATAKVGLLKPAEQVAYRDAIAPNKCPETLRIGRLDGQPSQATLRGPGFEFLPASPLQLVTCDSGRILVASGVYSSDLLLDLLTLDGEHLAQGYVRLPLPLETRWAAMPEVELSAETVKIVLLVNRSDWKSPPSAYAQVQINATLHCHKSECAFTGIH